MARSLAGLRIGRKPHKRNGRRTSGEVFDAAKAGEGGATRVKGAERLRDAVVKALGKIHAQLDADQRKHLACLIRTGGLTI